MKSTNNRSNSSSIAEAIGSRSNVRAHVPPQDRTVLFADELSPSVRRKVEERNKIDDAKVDAREVAAAGFITVIAIGGLAALALNSDSDEVHTTDACIPGEVALEKVAQYGDTTRKITLGFAEQVDTEQDGSFSVSDAVINDTTDALHDLHNPLLPGEKVSVCYDPETDGFTALVKPAE